MGYESGGYSEKLGNRYEGRWVVRQMLFVLGGRRHTITLEAIGDDEKGVDLWVEMNDGKRNAQQCKGSLGSKNHWSMASLNSKGILSHLRYQIERDEKHTYTLVSAVSAQSLVDLTRRAKDSNGIAQDFYEHQVLSNEEVKREFHAFCSYLKLDWSIPDDLQSAYELLQNSDFHHFAGDFEDELLLEELAAHHVNADPGVVVAVLADFAETNLRKIITALDISKLLQSKGMQLRNLSLDDRICKRVNELQNDFRDTFAGQLAGGALISRTSAANVLEKIDGSSSPTIVVLHGRAGFGKSGVLLELASLLEAKAIPYLPFRLDRQSLNGSPKNFGNLWGLPDSPGICLSQLVGEKSAVLILDQVDAIRWTSGHASDPWLTCHAMIKQALSLGNIHVVVACRTFDLDNDPQISAWAKANKLEKLEVSDLDDTAVQNLVGETYASLNQRQRNLLRSVQNLTMWLELAADSPAATGFVSAADLMKKFWRNRYEELNRRNVPREESECLINVLIDHFNRNGVLSAPERKIEKYLRASKELQSLSVIRIAQKTVTFCHQSYYDYLLASRIADEINAGSMTIFDWLGDKSRQSLFRREQLRLLLLLMRDENPTWYINTLSALITSNEIRFHLKHLCLQVMGQADEPTEQETRLVLELVADPYWREHITSQVLWQNPAWICLEAIKDLLREWLGSENDGLIDQALWLLRSVDTKCGDLVAEMIGAFEHRVENNWRNRIDWMFVRTPQDDSDRLFEMRLRLMSNNRTQDYLGWEKFANSTPHRCLPLIAASLQALIYEQNHPADNSNDAPQKNRPSTVLEFHSQKELAIVVQIAECSPNYVWENIVPLFQRFVLNRLKLLNESSKHTYVSRRLPRFFRPLRKIIEAAGQGLMKSDFDSFSIELLSFAHNRTKYIQRISINCLLAADVKYSDTIISWLLQDSRRFELGKKSTPNRFLPARRLIKKFSKHCSEPVFRNLEEMILRFHSKDEWKSFARRHQEIKHGWNKDYEQPTYYGIAHYFLLSALPRNRMSIDACQAVGVAAEKFGKRYPTYFAHRVSRCGGSIISPIPSNKLHLVSDKVWLKIIVKFAKVRTHEKWRQVDEEHATECSAETFSRSLGHIAKRQPSRFARLALSIPKETSPLYLQEIMQSFETSTAPDDCTVKESIAWEPADAAEIEAVYQHAQRLGHHGLEHSFCSIVRKRPQAGWSRWAFDELGRFAISHPSPEKEELISVKDWNDRSLEDLEITAINYVRGPAAQAIHSLLFSNPELFGVLQAAINSLLIDKHPSVRIAATGICHPLWNMNRELAVQSFLKICEDDDDRVLASHNAISFVNYAQREFIEVLKPHIIRMVNSDVDEVIQHGAARTTCIWLYFGQLCDLFEQCLTGSILQRIGIASVSADCVVDPKCGEKSRTLLLQMFNDPDKNVREKTCGVFRKIGLLEKLGSPDFVIAYTGTQAFRDNPTELISCFEDYKGNLLPYREAIMAICARISEHHADESRSNSSHMSYYTDKLPTLLLRIYEQAQGNNLPEVQNHCLDNWDRLLERRVGSIRNMIEKIDI
jgi:hypothetical protein